MSIAAEEFRAEGKAEGKAELRREGGRSPQSSPPRTAQSDAPLGRANGASDGCGGNVADPTGFEPAISSVTGWHVGPLHHGS